MFRKRIFYYLISTSFVVGLYWGVKNSDTLFPELMEKLSDREEICLALPKEYAKTKLLQHLAAHDYKLEVQSYESKEELQAILAVLHCEVFVFPSKLLGLFSDSSRLIQFRKKDFSFERISPDFLGLRFDRLNQHFIPISYWTENKNEGKTEIHLLLATSLNVAKNVNTVKELISHLLSNEVQTLLSQEHQLGTVIKDSEISLPIKASDIRKLNLLEVSVVTN